MGSMSGYVLVVESRSRSAAADGRLLRAGRYEIAAETEASWAKRSIAVRTPDAVVLDTSLADGRGSPWPMSCAAIPTPAPRPSSSWPAGATAGPRIRTELLYRYAPAAYLMAAAELPELRGRLDAAAPVAARGARHDAPSAPADRRNPNSLRRRRPATRRQAIPRSDEKNARSSARRDAGGKCRRRAARNA